MAECVEDCRCYHRLQQLYYLMQRGVFCHGHKYGVGSGDGSEHKGRLEQVDFIGQPGGISVAGFDNKEIACDSD